MTNKQLVHQLYDKIVKDLNTTTEQLELIVQLYQAFETDEERTLRLQKFREVVAKTQQSKI